MTPRETTVTVRSGLWVTVDEWEASAKVTVSYKGKLLAAPRRIRLRDGKEGRLERFKAQVLTPANWPTRDGDHEEEMGEVPVRGADAGRERGPLDGGGERVLDAVARHGRPGGPEEGWLRGSHGSGA